MPEIYADWKSLQPLTEPVPVGTKCVVIAKNKIDNLELGEIVTTFGNQSIAPWCRNSDMVHDALGINQLAILPADHKAEQNPEPTAEQKPERKIVQIAADPLGIVALCSDGVIWVYSNVCGDWTKLPPIPQD